MTENSISIVNYLPLGLILTMHAIGITIPLLMNTKWRDIGEGFSVRDIGNQRLIYIGTWYGQAKVCSDNNRDGVIDNTYVNMPITPMMGGPGYRLMRVETTKQDLEKFERANYLLNKLEGKIK